MPRVKRGVMHSKRRKNILKQVKGFRHGRKKLIKLAQTALLKAGRYAYRDRRLKKRAFRSQWSMTLSAALKPFDLSYSKFIGLLKKSNVELDRKVLADLAENNPAVFAKVVEKVK